MLNLIKKRSKEKKIKEGEDKKSEVELDEKLEEEIEEEINREDKEEAKKEEKEDDITTKLMERINEIENKLPRIDVSIENIKREIDEIKSRLQKIDDTLKDIMVIYELVSSQINPFISSSGIIDVGELKKRVDNLERDLKLFFINIDLDKIIREVLEEEVI